MQGMNKNNNSSLDFLKYFTTLQYLSPCQSYLLKYNNFHPDDITAFYHYSLVFILHIFVLQT